LWRKKKDNKFQDSGKRWVKQIWQQELATYRWGGGKRERDRSGNQWVCGEDHVAYLNLNLNILS
jgi:hypothetical protein